MVGQIDHNILFYGNEMAMKRRAQNMQQRGVDLAEKQADLSANIENRKLQTAGMDVDKLAERAMLKTKMGVDLNPMEKAGLEAWDTMQQTGLTTDLEGNVFPSKRSIYDVMGKTGGFNPAADRPMPTPGTWHQPDNPTMGEDDYPASSMGTGAMKGLYGTGPANMEDIPRLDVSMLDGLQSTGDPAFDQKRRDAFERNAGLQGTDMADAVPNPNRDQLPMPNADGMTPYRRKETFSKTNDANTDLSKEKLKNQVPGLKTRDGYVPSANDATQTKEVVAAKNALDTLVDQYEQVLEKYPNPIAGTAEAQRVAQLQDQIGAQIKSLETLGSYDAGVERLMKGMLGNPIIADGTTVDIAMNPLKAASSTWTKADTEKARQLNKDRTAQFRSMLQTKLKTTADARGFEPPSTTKGAQSWEEYFR